MAPNARVSAIACASTRITVPTSNTSVLGLPARFSELRIIFSAKPFRLAWSTLSNWTALRRAKNAMCGVTLVAPSRLLRGFLPLWFPTYGG